MNATLEIRKPKPGDAVVRFGDWTVGEPVVILDRRRWASAGSPVRVVVDLDMSPGIEPRCGRLIERRVRHSD